MDNAKKIIAVYASGVAGTVISIASTFALGLSAPISIVFGVGVALGGVIAVSKTD